MAAAEAGSNAGAADWHGDVVGREQPESPAVNGTGRCGPANAIFDATGLRRRALRSRRALPLRGALPLTDDRLITGRNQE